MPFLPSFLRVIPARLFSVCLEDGTPFLGRLALRDTMKDLIVDTIGAAVMSVIGYISLKHQKGWVEKLLLKAHKHHGTV